ncbi:MAG TPA: hypothetical protein VMD59_19450 [Acidimicrobiales bacterium]|nr:hypothetical protein [Acidimicrobiales bacterium]
MLPHRIHELAYRALAGSSEVSEHQAVVELLVLTAYSDKAISTDELDALEEFDVEHAGWDEGSFSVQQYLPVAVAKVRRALDEAGGADRVLTDAASRINEASVRAEAVKACNELAELGGVDPTESAVISKIEGALH